jgi:hypothetical protein
MFTKPLEVVMKNLLIALVVLSSLVSCGKKNVAGPTTAVNGLNGLTVTGTTELQLGSMIDNDQFGTGLTYVNGYQESFKQLITNSPNVTFNYSNIVSTNSTPTSNNNSHCIGTFYGVCMGTLYTQASWSSSSTIANTTVSRSVVGSSVNIIDKKNALKAILNARVGTIQQNGTIYTISTSDSRRYMIDTSLPLQANPAETKDAQGNGDYYSGWKF